MGCGTDSNDAGVHALSSVQYPGAPIITLKKTDWDPNYLCVAAILCGRLQYRLEAKEPLPYDIEVKLAIRGTSKRVEGQIYEILGIKHSHSEDAPYSRRHKHWADLGIHHQMREGRSVLGATVDETNIFYRDIPRELVGTVPSLVGHLDAFTLSIVAWEGIGDAPYNVGIPHTITVKR